MGLAHQTISQIGSKRLEGALENAQIKVVFGTGRQTAKAIVEELFAPDLQEVKHEVEDEEQRPRIHPTFSPLFEQWEKFGEPGPYGDQTFDTHSRFSLGFGLIPH